MCSVVGTKPLSREQETNECGVEHDQVVVHNTADGFSSQALPADGEEGDSSIGPLEPVEVPPPHEASPVPRRAKNWKAGFIGTVGKMMITAAALSGASNVPTASGVQISKKKSVRTIG